jgi:hypothetical protein
MLYSSPQPVSNYDGQQPASSYTSPETSYDQQNSGYEPPSSGGYEPPSSSYQPYQEEPDSPVSTRPKKKSFMDDDDDELAAPKPPSGEKTKAEKDREADEAFRKAAEEDGKLFYFIPLHSSNAQDPLLTHFQPQKLLLLNQLRRGGVLEAGSVVRRKSPTCQRNQISPFGPNLERQAPSFTIPIRSAGSTRKPVQRIHQRHLQLHLHLKPVLHELSADHPGQTSLLRLVFRRVLHSALRQDHQIWTGRRTTWVKICHHQSVAADWVHLLLWL